jgi:mevalonate kinase
VRSTLPVGAGLGSSAAFSACIATAILILNRRISAPRPPAPSRPSTNTDPGHLHISHEGRRAIPQSTAEEINRWTYVSEKVLHGNPSGVDNSIVVFGGALSYTKPGFGKKSGMEKVSGYVIAI